MKQVTVIAAMAVLLIYGCKKLDTTPPPAGDLTITGFSPSRVSFGDVLTVSGTGFSTVPSENVMEFPGENASPFEVSPTQMKLIVPDLTSGTLTPGYYAYLQLHVGNKEAVYMDEPLYFNRSMSITHVYGSTANSMVPGDSVRFEGSGFRTRPQDNIIKIGNSNINPVWIDSSYWCKMGAFFPASQCSGGDNSTPDTATALQTLSIRVGGQVTQRPYRVALFPRAHIQYFNYDQAATNGYYFVRIKHKSILPGTYVNMTGPGVNTSSLLDYVYQDQLTDKNLIFLAQNINPGTYVITITRGSRVYMNRTITFI